MARSVTYVVELLVGLGCLLAGTATLRSTGMRWIGAVLIVAGLAAMVHALAELVP